MTPDEIRKYYEDCDLVFQVATFPDYYGSEAVEGDADNYADFAQRYLSGILGEEVEIEYVSHYPHGESDEDSDLREWVWQQFLRTGGN